MITAPTIGSRLAEARKRLNWSVDEVAGRTKFPPSMIRDFESGEQTPQVAHLVALATALGRDMVDFLREEEPISGTVLWATEPTAGRGPELRNRLVQLAKSYRKLETLLEEESSDDVLSFSPNPRPMGRTDLEGFLANLSNPDWSSHYLQSRGFGKCPGWTLYRVVEEDLKIKVFHSESEASGCVGCTLDDAYGAAILLDGNAPRWQRNFDLAHGLFHLIAWGAFHEGERQADIRPTATEERLADCFAARLLVPAHSLDGAGYKVWRRGRLTPEDVFEIARIFDVPVATAARRLAEQFRLEPGEQGRAIEDVAAACISWGRPAGERPAVLPARYQALARRAYRRGLISAGKFAEAMQISRAEAAREPVGELCDDAEIEVGHA